MIRSGEKKVEYREIKEYWSARFVHEDLAECYYRNGDVIYKPTGAKAWVEFKNGYGAAAPRIKALVSLSVGQGRTDWGAAEGVDYYRLFIHEIEGD